MSVSIEPISELNNRAKHALVQALGAVDAMRFLNQLRAGDGNYTVERDTMLQGESVKSILDAIKAKRNEGA